MKLLFINALKGLRHKKVQMLGIIFLVLLSTCIYTTMNMAIDRFEDRYYSYQDEQNVEDLSVAVAIDYKTAYTYDEVLSIKNRLTNIPSDQQALINMYLACLKNDSGNCNEDILEGVAYIFDMYKVNTDKKEDILNNLAEKHDFVWEYTNSKVGQDDKIIYRIIPYLEDKEINKPYLIKGDFPKFDNEITILEGYALANDIKIGDTHKLGDKEYKVVGFTYSSDYMYPIISISSPIFDKNKNNIVFMTENAYSQFKGIEETINSIKFNDSIKDKEKLTVFKDEKSVYFSVFDMLRLARTESPKMEFNNDRLFAEYFLYVLLSISVIIILVISKKRIEDERLQIGVLKALGYKTNRIAISYLTYPIIGGFIGGLIGYFGGLLLHPLMTKVFIGYFNIPISDFKFDWTYLFNCTLIPIIVLSILTYLISLYMLRHKALYLLREGSNLKVNLFNRILSKLISKLPFKNRFRYSLASRSLGKLFIVTITSFCTGLLIVLVLIGMNLFTSMIDKSFKGFDFEYMISYIMPMKGTSNDEDLILEKNLKVEKVYGKNNKPKELLKRSINNIPEWTINGVDDDIKYVDILDKNGKDISNKITDDHTIIINSNISELSGIDVGDKVKFENNENTYKVVGINDSFFGQIAYTNRSVLSEDFGMELSYNKKFTINEKYSSYSKIDSEEIKNIGNIFGIKDLKENMETGMQTSNYSIYIIISFASIMALIIIAVIANIVVEENKKTISLMKVMGYNNKNISSIVLNIYTPFVIIAYLLSIPAMVSLLKAIVGVLTKDIDFAIPIGLSYEKAFIGLFGLLLGYYLAIALSKRALNKVALAVALKRE